MLVAFFCLVGGEQFGVRIAILIEKDRIKRSHDLAKEGIERRRATGVAIEAHTEMAAISWRKATRHVRVISPNEGLFKSR